MASIDHADATLQHQHRLSPNLRYRLARTFIMMPQAGTSLALQNSLQFEFRSGPIRIRARDW
jgi:hypothetical protein